MRADAVPTGGEIAAIDHFSGLSSEELDRRFNGSTLTDYAAGDVTLDPDRSEATDNFPISGRWWRVRRIVVTETAREWIDDRPGNWHGGIGPVDKVAPPDVRAVNDCRVLHVPRDLLDDLDTGNAHVTHAMLRGVRSGATMRHTHATGEY